MKSTNINSNWRGFALALLLSLTLGFWGNASSVSAHEGEDHGDEKPKAPTTTAGTISRTARLGDVEIMLKHPLLEPDTAAAARLFITKFATNEPFDDANPAVEIEPANGGSVTGIAVEKIEAGGSYILKIPAFPEGAYTIRVKANVGGKIDTTTFSGVEIAHHEAAETSGGSWLQTLLIGFLLIIGLALFGGLIYFAVKIIRNTQSIEETVSA
ncbi:MAG: hypothetical protein ACR2IA_00620 [Pyrinomonadaceae bacterium]